jgi:hypothetical protein
MATPVTAISLIKRAMRLAGVYSLGDEPSPEEAQAGLEALNTMIDGWANESLMIYAQSVDVIPIVSPIAVYTLGPTGTVVTTRPMSMIDSSYVIYQGISYPVPLLALDQYNMIAYKTQGDSFPYCMWAEMDYPNVTLTVYPVPSDASVLYAWSLKQLPGFASLTTEALFPPGYADALAFNLAVNFGPEFDGADIPVTVQKSAINSKRIIKRTNTRALPMRLPSAVLPNTGWVNWRTGA